MNKKFAALFVVFLLCLAVVLGAELTGTVPAAEPEAAAPAEGPITPVLKGDFQPPEEPKPQPEAGTPEPAEPEKPAPQELPQPEKPTGAEAEFFAVMNSESYNNELQIYLPEQTEFDGNHMIFTADLLGQQYVSGKAESIKAIRYGSFAFRVKTVRGTGLFPAIWMLPADGSELPEVDIYEMIGSHPEWLYGVLHYQTPTSTERQRDFYKFIWEQSIPESCEIRFEWTPEAMNWYVDGVLRKTVAHHVPDIPMYLILNLAVGGNWPGDPDELTVFPTALDVEVVEFNPTETYER